MAIDFAFAENTNITIKPNPELVIVKIKIAKTSTTKSGINTQNIIIKDEAEQLKRTGKTDTRMKLTAIKTDNHY